MRAPSIVAVVVAAACFAACRSTADDARAQIADLEDRRVARPEAWERLLTRGDDESRRRAVRAVGRIRDPALTAALVRALDVESSERVVSEELFALGQIGDASALDVLLKQLESKSAELRATAAEAIGKLGVARVAPNLVAHLVDPVSDVRGASLLALARLVGRRAKLAEPLDADAAHVFLQAIPALLDDRDESVRWKAAYALAEVEIEGRVPSLVAAAHVHRSESDWQVRFFAAGGLARAKGEDELREKTLETLEHGFNRQVVAAARSRTVRLEPDQTAAPLRPASELVEQARHALTRYVRVDALRELAQRFGDYDAIRGPLVLLGADADAYVASEAYDALAKLARASTTVASYAQQHSQAEIDSTKRELLEAARRGVAADDLAIVGNAFELLNVVGSKEDASLVVAAFDRRRGMDDAELRCDAVRSVGVLEGKEAIAFLRRAKRDESPAVVAAAKEEWKQLGLADDPTPLRALEGRPGAADEGGPPSSVAIESGVDFLRSTPNPKVALHFAKGDVVVELLREEAPRHVKMLLTRVRLGLCNGLPIHRVVPGFVVQGFDPRGDGWGNGGVFLRDEVNRVAFERGVVGMPNTGPDSGGCQLFFTLVPTPHLDGRYTVFGRVVAGMDVVDELEVGDACIRAEEVR